MTNQEASDVKALRAEYTRDELQVLFDLLHGRFPAIPSKVDRVTPAVHQLQEWGLVTDDGAALTLAGRAECVLLGYAEVVAA